MKEKAISVIIVLLLLFFSGCVTTDDQTNETNGNQTQEPENQEQNETENEPEDEPENTPPIAIISFISEEAYYGPAPFVINLTGEDSFDYDGDIVKYEWYYDDVASDGGSNGWQSEIRITYVHTDINFSNTYLYPGQFDIKLQVYDNDGAIANDSFYIIVT